MLWIILSFAILTIVTAIIITIIQKVFAVKEDPIVEKIDKILPQTQCGQCGYPGCLPYAQAVANGDEINKCTPGGQETVEKLAELLNREVPAGEMEEPEDLVAIIDEPLCIGCVRCIEACPVDAIIGAKKLMHVIITDYCTGCKLCVEPCPVKCIHMIDRKKDVDKFAIKRAETNFPKGVTTSNLLKVVNIPDNNCSHTASSLQLPKYSTTILNNETNLQDSLNINEVVNINNLDKEVKIDNSSYSSALVTRLAAKIKAEEKYND